MVSATPNDIARTESKPAVNKFSELANSSTITAPEHGRSPVENTIEKKVLTENAFPFSDATGRGGMATMFMGVIRDDMGICGLSAPETGGYVFQPQPYDQTPRCCDQNKASQFNIIDKKLRGSH